MSFFEKLNLFKKKNPAPVTGQTVETQNQPASVEPEKEDDLGFSQMVEAINKIKELNKEAKHAKTSQKREKTELKIQELKDKFKTDFGRDYEPDPSKLKRELLAEEAERKQTAKQTAEPSVDNINVDTSIDNTNADNASVKADNSAATPEINTAATTEEEKNQDNQAKPDINLPFDYRHHLERIKIQKGNINNSQFQNPEALQWFTSTLTEYPLIEDLSKTLLYKKSDKDLAEKISKIIAEKVDLPEAEIQEIYKTQEESLIAEAKEEINRESSRVKRIGLAVGKSAFYIGAGVLIGSSALAATSIGVGVGMGAIAVARVIDRLVTDKRLNKKLNDKVLEIKERKTEDDKLALQNRLAAAISIKKKIEIGRVNLGDKGERAILIDQYIEEQHKFGSLDIPADKLMDYKDKIIRTLEGLDDIDRLNAEKEAELNKTSGFNNLIKKIDKNIIGGESTREKVVAAAVFSGLGFVAREITLVRRILAGLAGYRLGGALFDHLVKDNTYDNTYGINPNSDKVIITRGQYIDARRKLLDKNFQNNNPEEYIKLKARVDEAEDIMLGSGQEDFNVAALNSNLESRMKEEKSYSNDKKVMRALGRLLGTGMGLALGEVAHLLLKDWHHDSSSSGSGNKVPEDINKPNSNIETGGPKNSDKSGIIDTLTSKPKTDSTTVPPVETTPAAPKSGSAPEISSTTPKSGTSPEISPASPKSGVSPETPAPSTSKAHTFEDLISNKDSKHGQTDSVWRSTNQIFKDHAAELGYKGDIKDSKALEAWSQIQTGKAINNSGELTYKVFEGNKVVLNQDSQGHYRIEIEEGKGFTPGHLEHHGQGPRATVEEAPNSSSKVDPNLTIKARGIHEESLEQFVRRTQSQLPEKQISGASQSIESQSSSGGETASAATQEAHTAGEQASHAATVENSKGAGGSSEAAKSEGIKNAAENQEGIKKDGSRVYSKWNVDQLGDDQTRKAFSSVDNLKDLPNGSKANLGEMTVFKNQDQYTFIEKDGSTFKMEINEPGEGGHNDKFEIIRDNNVLSGRDPATAGYLKQMIYDNLLDKRTSFAKELLKEIMKNKQEAGL